MEKMHLATYLSIILLSSISLGSFSALGMEIDSGTDRVIEKQPDAEELRKLEGTTKTIAEMLRSYIESYPLIGGGIDRPEFIKNKYQQALNFFDSASSDSQPWKVLQLGLKSLVKLAVLGDESQGAKAREALSLINIQEHPEANEHVIRGYAISKAPEPCTVIPEGCEIICNINRQNISPELRRALVPFDSCTKPLAIPTGIDFLLKLIRAAKPDLQVAIEVLRDLNKSNVGKYWMFFLTEREDIDDLLCMYGAASMLDSQSPAKKQLLEGNLKEAIEELKKQSDNVANLQILMQLNKQMSITKLYGSVLLGQVEKHLAESTQIEEAISSLKLLESGASSYEKAEYARVISSFQKVSVLHRIGEAAKNAMALGDEVSILKIFSKFEQPAQKLAIIKGWPTFEEQLAKLSIYDMQEQLVQEAILALQKITKLSTFSNLISALQKKSLQRISQAAFYARDFKHNVSVLGALFALYKNEAVKEEFLKREPSFAQMMSKYEVYVLEAQIISYIERQLAQLISTYDPQDIQQMYLSQNQKYQIVLKAINEKKLEGQTIDIMRSLVTLRQCLCPGYYYPTGFKEKLQSLMEEIILEVEQISEGEPKLIPVYKSILWAIKK